MEEESILWIAFSCPQGHSKMLVMPLGLKKCTHTISKKDVEYF
jgi:hypothetical protein